MMSSMFYFFSDLDFLDLRVFSESAIWEWFLTWRFKHARNSVRACTCVCVCIPGHECVKYVQIMRWWCSNLGQWPLCT